MLIDLKTGKVTGVAILKSSGSDQLDREAIFALRQWRFRPGKLTKADMPITWQASGAVYLPPGARLTPNR
jgi:TonB family protein